MADACKAEREPKSRQSHSTREEVRKVEPTETIGVRTDELPAPRPTTRHRTPTDRCWQKARGGWRSPPGPDETRYLMVARPEAIMRMGASE